MSRGLGKLQRALMEVLRKRTKWTVALDLAMETALDLAIETDAETRTVEVSNAHMVAVRRALHGLHRRQLVCLVHQGLHHYRSEFCDVNIRVGAEVLCVWLPEKHQRPVGVYGLNPKRCVREQSGEHATLSVEQRREDLLKLEALIGQHSKRSVPALEATTQHLGDLS